MLELAQVARGWNRTQLADALGRDPSRLVPASGNPKLDTIVRLSRILEWPIGDVVESLYDSTSDTMDLFIGTTVDESIEERMEGLDAEGLYQLAIELAGEGRWHECLLAGQRLRRSSESHEQIASGHSFETVCWMRLGRYSNALEACKAGLERTQAPDWIKRNLQVNMASCLYLLWDLQLSLGAADLLVKRLAGVRNKGKSEIGQCSAIHYLRANIHRRLITQEPEYRDCHIHDARKDYDLVRDLSARYEWPGTPFEARLIGSKLGLIEVEVEAGTLAAEDGVDEVLCHLDGFEILEGQSPQILEEIGWGCIYGCNLSIRHLRGRRLAQAFAVLSNKALDIAAHIDNWAIKERAYSLQCAIQASAQDPNFVLDDEDRADIVAVMGRFPDFYARGWRLIDQASNKRRW